MPSSASTLTTLNIAVVGHTNTGKTSLMRTLLYDVHFGQVADAPSTTQHVACALIEIDADHQLALFDTPGFEEPIALVDYFEQLEQTHLRLDTQARLQQFLISNEAKGRFEQEAKVLRQLCNSDVGLYVIDSRTSVLAKYQDELALLAQCGKPLLPVLNFIAHPDAQLSHWKTALAQLGLHTVVMFDTVSPPTTPVLYEKLALVTDQTCFSTLVQKQITQHQQREQRAYFLLAETLVDITAWRVLANTADQTEQITQLQAGVRQREQRLISSLLHLYRFRAEDVVMHQLPLIEGRFEHDLFSMAAVTTLSKRVGQGAAAGAGTGVMLDLAVGGLTLGAAAGVGAFLGSVWQIGQHYGQRLKAQWLGHSEWTIEDGVIASLFTRQLQLIHALGGRGHAAIRAVVLSDSELTQPLPRALYAARAHPEWSALDTSHFQPENATRDTLINQVQQQLASSPITL